MIEWLMMVNTIVVVVVQLMHVIHVNKRQKELPRNRNLLVVSIEL